MSRPIEIIHPAGVKGMSPPLGWRDDFWHDGLQVTVSLTTWVSSDPARKWWVRAGFYHFNAYCQVYEDYVAASEAENAHHAVLRWLRSRCLFPR